MKRKKFVYEYKAKTTDYLVALAYYPNFLKLLNVTEKPYSRLIEWLLSKEPFLLNDSLELPSLKELSKELNIESAKLTNLNTKNSQ